MVHSITPLAVKELLSQFPEAETFLKEIKYPELDLHYEDDVKTEKDKFSFEISFTATLHGQPKKESVWPAYPDELYGDIDLDSLKTKNEFNGAITFYSGGRKAGNLGRLLKKFDHGQLVGEQSNAVNQRVVVPSISEKARTTIGNLLPGLSGLRGMGKAPGSIDDSGSTSA